MQTRIPFPNRRDRKALEKDAHIDWNQSILIVSIETKSSIFLVFNTA